ncbi:MAG: sugar-binding protein [Oscillospiraceae bacterium]|jgi:putative multiple sugar transport system substrate-binding protein|nr:sugar-binding protein [Oscillospiraceae bacterium]
MKKTLAILVTLTMVLLLLAACNGDSKDDGNQLVGISMPTQTSERWIMDGNTLKDILVDKGFEVELQFAGDSISTQQQQITDMLSNGAKVLVVAAVDGSRLSSVLEQAAKDGVYIISYDRLLVDTEAVSYYATFDNVKVGELQAQSLIDGLKAKRGEAPWNIELFAGSPDDTNSAYFFGGAMNILQPYIDRGDIVIPSGLTAQSDIGTLRWDGDLAKARMEKDLEDHYNDGKPLHGVLSPYDGLSRGIITALKNFGFEPGSDNWPVVTGQDAESESIALIRSGEQHSTVLKDTRDLAAVAANMVVAVLQGLEVDINDTTTYHNNIKFVPSYLLVPYSVDASNYRQLVIESGYLKESDIG